MSKTWLFVSALLILPFALSRPATAFQSSPSPISTTQTFSQALDSHPGKVWEAMQRVTLGDPRVEVLDTDPQQLVLRFRIFMQGHRPFSETTADADITAKLKPEQSNNTLMLLSVTTVEHPVNANASLRSAQPVGALNAGYAKMFIRRVQKALKH